MNDKEIKKFVRTGLLLGLGAASLTKEKVNILTKKITNEVKQKNITKKEGRKALNNFLKKTKTEQKRIEKIVNGALKQIAKPYVKKAKKRK